MAKADAEMGAFYKQYFDALFSRIEKVFDLDDESKERLISNIMKKAESIPLFIENNYKNTEIDTDSEQILNLYFSKKPTISGYGVLFKTNAVNVPGKILEHLIKQRKVVKNEMFKHANDEDKTIYNMLDVEQKVIKVLANAYYGAFGQSSFHFYNPVLGPSVN